MIALLTGTVEHIGLDEVTVVNGGIGWAVKVTPPTAHSLIRGNEVTLHIVMDVKEDAIALFGFLTRDEKDVFTVIRTVSGVGPRIALAALAVLTPDQLRDALAQKDSAQIRKIPGVGPKLADRIVLEIGNKLGPAAHAEDVPSEPDSDEVTEEVTAALVQLGWTQAIARKAVNSLAGQGMGASDLLRASLIKLGGTRG